ncbi:MAG: hypothetical protein WCW67_07975 [Candidatus Margulisiibacteriota bacterium]|jgi:hypothetical protein
MNKPFLLIALSLLSFAAFGCGASKPAASNIVIENFGYVTIGIHWSEGVPATKIAISAVTAGKDPVFTEMVYPQAVATLKVVYGASYDLFASAKNAAGQVLAVAETKGVVVTEEETPPISFFFKSVAETADI